MNTITFNTTVQNGVIRIPKRLMKKEGNYPATVQIAYTVSDANDVEDNTLMSKEVFFAKINEALEHAKRGEVTRVESSQELLAHLNSL
jgi:hypothetical protein